MPQVIVIETPQSASSTGRILQNLSQYGAQSIMLIGSAMPEGAISRENFFQRGNTSLANCLHLAASKSTQENLLLVSPLAVIDKQQFERMAAQPSASAFCYAPVKCESGTVDFPRGGIENLIPFLAALPAVPWLSIALNRSFVLKHGNLDCQSERELIMQLYLLAVGSGAAGVERYPFEIGLQNGASLANWLSLNPGECIRCIKLAVESHNIEDLFPNHAWNKFQQESMAVCYHSLAAMFIKFGDLDAAQECLQESDKLEDSPRSLALKGLISLKKNETLGAAGNMISSLQQYEARKRGGEEHYLSFAPNDLEKINSDLKTGLDALNRKDNAVAVRHFAAAIFEFDSFYKDNGIDNIEAALA